MTIREAIKRADDLVPNDYTETEKISWLSTLDGMIKNEIYENYTEGDGSGFSGYTIDTNKDTALLVPAPYDEIYILWLECRVDYYNAEIDRYNNAATRFDEMLQNYRKEYNRTHTHKAVRIKYY